MLGKSVTKGLVGGLLGWATLCAACLGLILLIPARAATAAPDNDYLINATELSGTNVVESSTNANATKEVGEPNHAANPGGKSVWWRWTAPASGSVLIDTAGSTFDTLLAVYTGTTIGNLGLESSNDDFGSAKTSALAMNVIRGTAYRIAVDGFNKASGTIELHLSFRPTTLQASPNDLFEKRLPLSGVEVTETAQNFFATKEPGEPIHARELGGASLWWTWTAPSSGRATLSTEGSDLDTLLAVYTGSILTNLAEVASSDDIATNLPASRVEFTAAAGIVYQIAVDGFNGQTGRIRLQLQMRGSPTGIQLGMPSLSGEQGLTLTVTAPPGKQIAVQASSHLPDWTTIQTVSSSNDVIRVEDSAGRMLPFRFYRALQIP